jgi:hypothetical protein
LLNDARDVIPLAPIPVTDFLINDFATRKSGFTGALFTLPFGLRAFAEFSRVNEFPGGLDPAKLTSNRPEYPDAGMTGGIQLRADAPKHPAESPIFKGSTLQLSNVLKGDGTVTPAGTLGHSVGIVFNKEFFYDAPTGFKKRGVPLTRIDFSGYGASIFSHWMNPNAAIAATSQAVFDVFIGRTAQEVIQIRSLVYPWGIKVVRTITILRGSNANVFRYDSGWQAESPGLYDFSFFAYNPALQPIPQSNPYTFHPGVVRGVFNVRNIRETNAVKEFTAPWNKAIGDRFIDELGVARVVDGLTLPGDRNPTVQLQPLYFDCDVEIDGVVSGARNGRVPSSGMLGFVQLSPRGEPLSPALFNVLLASQGGALGGPVDCVINIAGSGQQMRISRVDVNSSVSAGGTPIFVSAARGAVILPKDGSWSVVQHSEGSGDVSPLVSGATVPLVRRGELLDAAKKLTNATVGDALRLAHPIELVRAAGANTMNFGILQSTGTQKALFRLPRFTDGLKELVHEAPDFADAYRIVNGAGIFPNVKDALPLALGGFKTKILEEGYKLLDEVNPDKIFEQILPEGPLLLVNESFLKIYVEYAKRNKEGNAVAKQGAMKFGFDSAAADQGKKWMTKVNDIAMVVDLGPLKRLVSIQGKFDAEKGTEPGFREPELVFSKALQPIIDILQVLQQLSEGDYKAALTKGLDVAMSNSAEVWSYSFHARKEIPVIKFPPGPAYNEATVPLKLEAHMAIGAYFNESVKLSSDPKDLIPSAGAFLEFGGRLSVMCLSVAAATVYATGSVDVRTSADTKIGPQLRMKFGFGVELVASIPVVGNVSLLFMVGVELTLDSTKITITGFLLFRGRAELLAGLVCITIQIEAKGTVERTFGGDAKTNMLAQVTFAIDISIFLIINIHVSKSWEETRQIA